MADSTTKMHRSARPMILIGLGAALYFATMVFALYELDRQYFNVAKKDIILDNFREIFHIPVDLRANATQILFPTSPSTRAAAMSDLAQTIESVVKGPSGIYRFTLKDATGAVVYNYADNEKPERLNNWSNSLLIRSFSGRTDTRIYDPKQPESDSSPAGYLMAYYCTPPNYKPIESLTKQYRFYAACLACLWTLVFIFIYKYLLRPMRNVTAYLEDSRFGRPHLIPQARGILESSYNDMASQALLQQLVEKLNVLPRAGDGPEIRTRTIQRALDFVRDAFGAESIEICELAEHDAGYTITESHMSPQGASKTAGEILGKISDDQWHFTHTPEGTFTYYDRLGDGMLRITGRVPTSLPDINYRLGCISQACETIRRGLLTFRAYQQDIFRQRSEANIVLSRNLGHDLTNIIATSKLELMAVKQLIAHPESAVGQKGALIKESVQGLLDNTRFLQEIVNIYRSFSNVKRPQYERYPLNELVNEFLAAFEPSISSRVAIKRELGENLPSPILEPRLIKLALFNVITNALDAIKRNPRPDGVQSFVIVRTLYNPATSLYQIQIEDNGPGVRNAEGRLLMQGELDAIFQYGYSTKTEDSEGLGLSWVRSIMEDFHAGSARAENPVAGGARFNLALKSMESAEAKISSQK